MPGLLRSMAPSYARPAGGASVACSTVVSVSARSMTRRFASSLTPTIVLLLIGELAATIADERYGFQSGVLRAL